MLDKKVVMSALDKLRHCALFPKDVIPLNGYVKWKADLVTAQSLLRFSKHAYYTLLCIHVEPPQQRMVVA